MRLIITENAAMIADVFCEHEETFVGTAEDCKVQLNDPRIAEQQAVFAPADDTGWLFRVLTPEPLIKINGMRVESEAPLKTGDEIRICDYVIRVFPDQHAAAPTPQGGAARPRQTATVARLNKFVQTQLPPGSLIRRLDEAVTAQAGDLATLGAVSMKLSTAETVEAIMDVAIQLVLSTFGAHRAWIGVRRVNYGPMEYVEGRTITGQMTELPDVGENFKPRVLDRKQFVLIPRVSAEEPVAVMLGPLPGPENMLGMLYVDSGETGRRLNAEDLDRFALILTLIAAQLEAVFEQVATNRAAMIAGEVSVAHAIQARITPKKLPQWPNLQLGAFREPGSEHTGDFYDVVRLSNGMALFLVAYTRTEGAVPSMLMAMTHSAFRFAAMHLDAPHVFLKSLNWMLADGQKDRPLDCFVGVVDPTNGQMRYAVAGQLGAFIIGHRGDERALTPEPVEPQLGVAKNVDYTLCSAQLAPSETLALFTPGVTTARNRREETFGEDRFLDILCDGFGQRTSAMLGEMLNDLRAFTEGGQQPDDITVLLAHRL